MPDLPAPPQIVGLPRPKERIVDPASDGKTPGVYRTVGAAVLEARDKDVILVKHDGPVALSPVDLKLDQHLTIRPFGKHRPVLPLAAKTLGEEAALFKVYHGQLHCEDLEFLLKPDRDFRAQTVAALGGNGRCSLERCVVTFESPADSATALSGGTVVEAKEAMSMPGTAPKLPPRIQLRDCFDRGKADLFLVPPSRPLAADV